MSPRIRLRLLDPKAEPAPSVAAVRARLGGRLLGAPHQDCGALVLFDGRPDELGPAVLLFVEASEAHVWLGAGLVRTLPEARLRPFEGEPPPAAARVAHDARAFAALGEGDRVSFSGTEGGPLESGVIVEKCRHGALVERPDGVVVGVGFRRLRRAPLALH